MEDSTYSSTNLNKYTCTYPLAIRLIDGFSNVIIEMIKDIPHEKIISLGCGEGQDIKHILVKNDVRFDLCCGLDIQLDALRYAQKELQQSHFYAVNGDICEIPLKLSKFNLLFCLEVLEHLKNPEMVLSKISKNFSGYYVISVPFEPLYRLTRMILLRQDIRRLGNHPDHLHCWTLWGLRRLVNKYFAVNRICVSYPWSIILCHTNGKKMRIHSFLMT
jgi:2-polyprenyl-3-methyl-5-hydroxy-6-metoxy-1,4-benzoquinol methylase